MIITSALLISICGVAIALVVRARSADMPRIQREARRAAAPRVTRVPTAPGASARQSVVVAPQSIGSASAPDVTGPTPALGSTAVEPAPRPQPAAAVRGERRHRTASSEPASARASTRAQPRRESTPPVLPLQPTREEVIAAMQRVAPAVGACFGNAHGKVQVAVTVLGTTGRVTTAKVKGQSGRVGSCIARAVRHARLPKFLKRKLAISYPFAR